jgi:uncharacterized membrane protein
MKMRVIALILALCLLVPSFSMAFTLDADTSKGAGIFVCPRETGVFKDTLTNTNSVEEYVEITVSGQAADWATVAPNKVYLAPGETKQLLVYVTPSKSAVAGEYSLIVNANEKVLVHKVNVKQCRDVEIFSMQEFKQTCPDQDVKYEFLVRNSGEYVETYTLEALGSGSLVLSDEVLMLNAKEERSVYVYVTAPVDAGDYVITLEVEAEKTVDSAAALLKVDSCYGFGMDVEESSISVCEHTASLVPISLWNEGTVSNRYDATVVGPTWVELTRNVITINSGLQKTFHLSVTPDYGVEGDFSAVVEVLPSQGDKKALAEFEINVKKCHNVALEIESEYQEVCVGDSRTNKVIVENSGEVEKLYSLEIDDWVSVNPSLDNFSLSPGEKKAFSLDLKPLYDGDYDINVEVVALDDSGVEAKDSFNVVAIGSDVCNAANVGIDLNDFNLYYDATTMVSVSLTNNGRTLDTYTGSISGVEFSRLDFSELILEPGETGEMFVYVAPLEGVELGSYSLDLNVRSTNGFVFNEEVDFEITDDASDEGNVEVSFWNKVVNWFDSLVEYKEVNVTEEDLNESVLEAVNETSEIEDTSDSLWEKSKYYILGALIVILLILILVRIGFFTRIKEIKKGDNKKESKKLKDAVSKK